MKILENSGESMYFVKIPVDRDRRTNQRPEHVAAYGIKEVPTIIIENTALAGINAFKWLVNRLENSATAVSSVSTRQNKVTNPDYPNLGPENSAEPIRAANAMGNEDQNANGPQAFSLTDSSTNSNFLQLSDMSDTTIYTPDESEDIQKSGNFILKNDNITAQAITTPYPQQNDPNKPRLTVRKDALKEKQLDNQYNKLLEERQMSMPVPPTRM
jgi:hypothetical protein